MKPYYYIYRVGGSCPTTKHFTVECAIKESNRLAAKHPGETFEILICVATTRCTTPATFWMDGVNPRKPTMRTYYDPEDDTCEKSDRYERLMDLADHLRDEAKDLEMEESYNNFAASSDAAEKSPVAMLPAEPSSTLTGELGGEAAGDYTLTDTDDSIRPPTEEEDASYKAAGVEYAQIARALLTRCFNVMTGREINACQIATGDYDTDEGFNAIIIELLAIQFSKEISEHINQHNQ